MKLRNPEIRIETTALCQAKCVICPREKMTRPMATMPLEHFISLADQAKDLGATTISLFGHGEPLMDRSLEDKIRYCKELGLSTFITSNAGLLNPIRIKKLIYSGLDHIRFSVHGFWDNYEKVHVGLKWETTRDNIDYFLAHRNGCQVSISVIPMYGESITVIRDFWENKRKVDFLEIWRPHNWCYGKSYRMLKVMKRRITCGRPENGPVQIQADGKMIVCCYDFNGQMVVGDTHKNTIEEILKGPEFNAIREKHKNGKVKGLICGTCDQLNIENDSPLLYSSRDKTRTVGKTSSTKFNMMEV